MIIQHSETLRYGGIFEKDKSLGRDESSRVSVNFSHAPGVGVRV